MLRVLLLALCLVATATADQAVDARHGTAYHACHADRVRLCPDMHPPFTVEHLFTSDCFVNNLDTISPECRTLFNEFHESIEIETGCKNDLLRFCPSQIEHPYKASVVFNLDCVVNHKDELSTSCVALFNAFHSNEGHPDVVASTDPPHHHHHDGGLHKACSADIQSYCSSVADSPQFLVQCLMRHLHQLSPECHRWIQSMNSPDTPQSPSPTSSSPNVYAACHNDRIAYCPHIHPPYNPATLFRSDCFLKHRNKISPVCRKYMEEYFHEQRLRHEGFLAVAGMYLVLISVLMTCILSCCVCCLCRRSRKPKTCKMVKPPAKSSAKDKPVDDYEVEENTFAASELKPVEMYSYMPMNAAPMAVPVPGAGGQTQFVVVYPQYYQPTPVPPQ